MPAFPPPTIRRRGARLLVGLLAGLAACVDLPPPATPATGGPPWEEIVSDHFIIETNLEPGEATELTGQLETARNVIIRVAFGRDPPPGPRARVLALRYDEFSYFYRDAYGVFDGSWFEPVFVPAAGDWGPSTKEDVRKHELAHCLAFQYVHQQPAWFAEGIATYLETVRYDERTGIAEVGRAPQGYGSVNKSSLVSLDELWRWRGDARGESQGFLLYASAWATFHYLIDERPEALAQYERALDGGQDPKVAWSQSFPDLDRRGLSRAIGFAFKVRRARVPAVHFGIRRRPLSEADVLGLMASLYMANAGSTERTEQDDERFASDNVAASLRANPASFWAHLVNDVYFDKLPSSLAIAKLAMVGQDDNWLAWWWYDNALRANHAPLQERRAALTTALHLAPGNARVLSRLARLSVDERREQTGQQGVSLLAFDGPTAPRVSDGSKSALSGVSCWLPEGTESLDDASECKLGALTHAAELNVGPNEGAPGFSGIAEGSQWYAIDFRGSFQVRGAGRYAFRLESDDGSLLWIDERKVIDNDGLHATRSKTRSVDLAPGMHRIRVLYFQAAGEAVLRLFVTPPGGAERLWSARL